MRCLFLSQLCPWPLDSGPRQRIYNLLSGLSKDFEITLLMFTDSAEKESVPDVCERTISVSVSTQARRQSDEFNRWSPFPKRMKMLLNSLVPTEVRALRSQAFVDKLIELKRDDFELVWVERAGLAEMVAEVGFKPVILDLDDVDHLAFERSMKASPFYFSKPLHYLELSKWKRYEKSLSRRFARVVVCKESDRSALGCEKSVAVVPNGAMTYSMPNIKDQVPGNILFVGQMDYPPNIDAMQYFVSEIMPGLVDVHPDLQLNIVGRDPNSKILGMEGPNIRVHGRLDDLTEAFSNATVVIAPIRLGSGTRLKVLEALARGHALVATSVATEGIDLVPENDFMLADTPSDFEAAVSKLLSDPELREHLGRTGREKVLGSYRWDSIQETVRELAREVVSASSVE